MNDVSSRRNAIDTEKNCQGDFDYYLIKVDFDAFADEQKREYLKHLTTSFYLPDADIDLLRDPAARVLKGTRDFQRLLHDLSAPAPAGDS